MGNDIRYSFTPRDGNKVAHGLAHLALNWHEECLWIEDWPFEISDLLDQDTAL